MTNPTTTVPTPGTTYRHTDGGLYRFLMEAKDCENLEPLYIYQHLWPFERLTWVRKASEWAERFTTVEAFIVTKEMLGDRETAQNAVVQAKAARRAAKAAAQ